MRSVARVAALLAAIAAGSTATPATASDRLCDASFQNCRTPLIDLIRNERVGIDVAFWFMEDTRYATALIERFRAGVPVRVIMDTEANEDYPYNATVLQMLQDARIPMREKVTGGIAHWKTMIFAGQHQVQFSGANYSPYAFVPVTPYVNYIDEVIYFTDNPAIVNSFMTMYDNHWVDLVGYKNYANVTSVRRRYPVYPIHSDMNFVPEKDFGARSVRFYDRETVGIDSVMFRITDRRHSDALIAARRRGVRVRIITEPGQYRDPLRLWHSWNVDRMYAAGISIRHRKHLGNLHQKSTILKSQLITVFGSSNWTGPSAVSQLEHNIFTSNSLFYSFFTQQFDRKWGNLTGNQETTTFVPLPPDAASKPSPANAAVNQPVSVTLKWYAGYWAHRYDIYFGTDPNALSRIVANAELGPSTTKSDLKTTTVANLARGRTYYWKVVSKTMANKTATSAVWSFRTMP
jgi:phosphatidylserine/phosphatidylglycerophosphate/cardiolipin synthase-like enzyme